MKIWLAGVEAVKPRRLFQSKVALDGTTLYIDDVEIDLAPVRRIVVVGAGKASAAMAAALHDQVLNHLPTSLSHIQVTGWINCPEQSFDSQLPNIYLHAARPLGMNSPTEAAVVGTRRIMDLVQNCNSSDLVFYMIAGGGSALLVAPPPGITLEDKQSVARLVAAAGGNIEQLNTIRRELSLVKGGGLARACRAGRLVSLIISDVLGDPLEAIASGPTVTHLKPNPNAAIETLRDLGLIDHPHLAGVKRYLTEQLVAPKAVKAVACSVDNVILGNNADAVDAAGVEAVRLGYRYVMQVARRSEGDVLDVARTATRASLQLLEQSEVDCWISGGEPTVTLPANCDGRGGRNQQLALATMLNLAAAGWPATTGNRQLAFVSGGTDGEDGPTDAAGAWFDAGILEASKNVDRFEYLRKADAYTLFEQFGGLVQTGPTGTNVCDLRVALARSSESADRR